MLSKKVSEHEVRKRKIGRTIFLFRSDYDLYVLRQINRIVVGEDFSGCRVYIRGKIRLETVWLEEIKIVLNSENVYTLYKVDTVRLSRHTRSAQLRLVAIRQLQKHEKSSKRIGRGQILFLTKYAAKLLPIG